jgi:heterotetrameric sarcosine oxidase gamma subunit
VASLIAKSAVGDHLPISHGSVTLREMPLTRITAIAPFTGREAATGTVLRKIGLDWPTPNRGVTAKSGHCLWSGRQQAFLINAEPDGLQDAAAVTDVSDGWVALVLEGATGAEVLARLVPIDLGPRAFPQGAVARTSLGHMMVLVHRAAPQNLTLYVFRSMVGTAVHEIEVAMQAVAARAVV